MNRPRHSRLSPSFSRSRSRSPRGSSNRHFNRRRRDTPKSSHADSARPSLPFSAMSLSKRDLAHYEPMFAMYLDIQKGIDLAELSERETKGRWKSFIGKWNRGELAEGWYDPKTFEKARDSAFSRGSVNARSAVGLSGRQSSSYNEYSGRNRSATRRDARGSLPYDHAKATQISEQLGPTDKTSEGSGEEEEEEEGSYGPQVPIENAALSVNRDDVRRVDKSGPKVPTMQDLQLRREDQLSSAQEACEEARISHKHSLKSHKSELRRFEDEIAPRAEPGTHERRVEKRREAAFANREFAESRRGTSPGEAPDAELMGGASDLEMLKREREKEMRKKNEREIRKEEILRARAAEREERLKSYRKKEEETMTYLRALAKEKFG
uniref:RNA helicase HEL117 n=1 Tax=Coccidioides posadasii RMSCC 3488 TaxID=454284 RepID=A0A0J6FU25_COCPO|nr:hypothetical protein CPAG_09180 [Coccidioides posadasii RMSCC 3488]